MTGARQRDDGWDEGRRDSWQNGDGYQPETTAGYQGTGYPNGSGYAGSGNHASQTGYGDQASGAGQGYGAQGYDARGYGPNGYPDSGYPGSGQSASGYGGAGYDSTGYSGNAFSGNGYDASGAPAAAGYADGGYAQSGYAATGASGQYGWASSSRGSEFLPADESASGNDNAAGTPRPYGRLSIFTLLDDKAAEFDRLAERAAEGVRTAEPDTLVYVIHVVPKAPMQRIIYEIYRDRAAFESHEQQPHIQRFVADRRSCVLATNIIDLRLKYAKVAALATAQAPEAAAAPGFGQETQLDRVPAGLGSGDRYTTNGYSAANGQYQSSDRYAAASQYPANGQYQATEQYARHGSTRRTTSTRRPAPRSTPRPASTRLSAASTVTASSATAASTAAGNIAAGSTAAASTAGTSTAGTSTAGTSTAAGTTAAASTRRQAAAGSWAVAGTRSLAAAGSLTAAAATRKPPAATTRPAAMGAPAATGRAASPASRPRTPIRTPGRRDSSLRSGTGPPPGQDDTEAARCRRPVSRCSADQAVTSATMRVR